jgi:hypothetical protein
MKTSETRKAALLRDLRNKLSIELERLAGKLNVPNEKQWAALQHRRINRAIARKRHDKLIAWHLKNNPPYSGKGEIPRAIVQAVFLQSELGKRKDFEQSVVRSKQVTRHDLNLVQKRAAEIVSGAKFRSKSNSIERAAMKLASAVEAYLTPANRRAGRPKGSSPNGITKNELNYQVPLSIVDVCAAVFPIVEEISGSAQNNDLVLNVMMAAVLVERPGASRATVAQAMYRGRSRNKPLISNQKLTA